MTMSLEDIISRDLETAVRSSGVGATAPASEKVPEEPLYEEVKFTYHQGQKPFSEVFPISSKSGMEHPITTFEPSDWPEEAQIFIPKKKYLFW